MFNRSYGVAALFVAVSLAGCGADAASAKPAATVNGHAISMRSYKDEFKSELIADADSRGYNVCQARGTEPLCQNLKHNTVTTLVDRELVREYAAKHGIKVSQAEFNQRWQAVFRSKFKGRADVVKAFSQRLGVSVASIKQGVRDDELQQKVLYEVTRSMPNTTPAIYVARVIAGDQKQAELVKADIARNVPFQQIAKQLLKIDKKGPCKTNRCGSLGWIPRIFIPPNRQELNQVRDGARIGPFPLQKGFEFFAVGAHDQQYVMTAAQAYGRRQQIFAQWLKTQEKRAKVKRYIAT